MSSLPFFQACRFEIAVRFDQRFSSLFTWVVGPFQVLFVAGFLGFLPVSSGTISAQDDPFDFGNSSAAGDFGTGFGGADEGMFGGTPAVGSSTTADAGTVLPVDPLILELRALAGGTPQQLGLAIRESIRLRNWAEMELYLGGGRVLGLSEADKLVVARRIGNLLLVRGLAGVEADRRTALKPESRQALESLLDVLKKNAVDSQLLDNAIRQLTVEDRNEQFKAVRVLRGGGDEAIRRIILAAIQEQSPTRLERLMEVLDSFGEPGFDAIELLAVFGAVEIRPGALRAADVLNSRRALPAALSAVAAAGSSDAERRMAAEILERSLGGIPSQSEVEGFLADRLRQADQNFESASPAAGNNAIWRVTEDRRSVEVVVVRSRAAAARRAAEAAEMVRRVGAPSPEVFAQALSADLRNRFLSNPQYGSPEDLKELAQLWGSEAVNATSLSRILDKSLGSPMTGGGVSDPQNRVIGDPAAAIATLRMLAALGDEAAVNGNGREFAALVRAASHPVPQVRYEAAIAIQTLHPKYAYPGSSTVLERWIEMSLLESEPQALVLVNELAKRQAIIQRLNLLGYRITEVPTVRSLIQQVDKGGDIELIVATSRPPDYSAIEMIDRVRRRPLGGAAPMIIVDGWPAGYEQFQQRWRAANIMIAAEFDPDDLASGYVIRTQEVAPHTAVASIDRPARSALTPGEAVVQLQLALLDLAEVSGLPPMTPVDRKMYAIAGLTALSRLTEDPETANLYDWKSKEAELAEASRRSAYSEASLRIMSAMGTPYSQDLLARIAINPEIAWETRQLAATAFADSIAASGTRISRRQVLAHYDRYNQSRDNDTRKVLDIILDAIEARAGVVNP